MFKNNLAYVEKKKKRNGKWYRGKSLRGKSLRRNLIKKI
jgi:hypothetical protein